MRECQHFKGCCFKKQYSFFFFSHVRHNDMHISKGKSLFYVNIRVFKQNKGDIQGQWNYYSLSFFKKNTLSFYITNACVTYKGTKKKKCNKLNFPKRQRKMFYCFNFYFLFLPLNSLLQSLI